MEDQSKKQLFHGKMSLVDFFNIDRILLILFSQQRRHSLTRTAILFTKIGNGHVWLILAVVLFIYYVPIGLAFKISGVVQLYFHVVLKKIFKRARPFQRYFDLEVLYPVPDPYSFPSGHTCAAFTMAFVAYQVLPVIWPYLFVLALIIAISRIYLAAHYPTDIFGGVLIGYYSAKIGVFCASAVTGIPL